MKNKYFTAKNLWKIGITAFLGIFSFSYLNFTASQSQVGLYKVHNGVGICFQRVSQSFTALMIKDLSSSFLTQDFMGITGECLNEVSKQLNHLGISKNIQTLANNLKSDLHWFELKTQKIQKLVGESDLDLSQSNLIDKFYALDTLKTELEDKIISEINQNNSFQNLTLLGLGFSLFSLLLSGGTFLIMRRIGNIELSEQVQIFKNRQEKQQYINDDSILTFIDNFVPSRVGGIVKEYIYSKENELKNLETSLIKQNSLSDQRHEISLDILEETENSKQNLNLEASSFNTAMNTVLDRLQDKVFNYGVFLDTDLNENFNVYSDQESLEQLLYTLLNFSFEKIGEVEGLRKIKLRSKPLGGIAYCKVSLIDYSFSSEEMEVLKGLKEATGETPVNLLLLKELLNDQNVSLSVKNRSIAGKEETQADIEIIFDRCTEDVVALNEESSQKTLKNIVKGSKSDIKEFFNRHLPRP